MTTKEYLQSKEPNTFVIPEEFLQGYAKIKCKELLEVVADNADIYIPDGAYMDCYVNPSFIEIDRSSILNAVDLETFIV